MDSITNYTEILPKGKENAISTANLAVLMGFDSARALQQDIARSRDAGQIILSATTGGYYLPEDDAEIEEFVRTLRARAISTFKALRSAKAALQKAEKETEGQLSLDDLETWKI